jgi:hypothetical protein
MAQYLSDDLFASLRSASFGGQMPYGKALNRLKSLYGVLPGQQSPRTQADRRKLEARQRTLLEKLKRSGDDRLAMQFQSAFEKGTASLHQSSANAINAYLSQSLERKFGEQLQDPKEALSAASAVLDTASPTHVANVPFAQQIATAAQNTPGVSGPLTGPLSAPVSAPSNPLEPRTPQATPKQSYASVVSTPLPVPALGVIDTSPEQFPTLPSRSPPAATSAGVTAAPSGAVVVEQIKESMATSSELVKKAAEAVDASAAATTELQATVKDTTDALKALTEAQTKTETASPALSQQVLAQIQGDPSLAKLVKDGLLKWDDILGPNPPPPKRGDENNDHVAGYNVGDTVIIASKLQRVIDNLQTARARESASLAGAIEVNTAARTTTGFRPSDTGYYPGRQVWMPIRAPPPSLPGRR